jgi:FAD/FMN-containing dehydrogenase
LLETLDSASLQGLRDRFRGRVLEAGDEGYDEARSIFNGMIDRRPRLIAQCAGAADVIAAVGLARETGLELSVCGGGHGVNGFAVCDGGIMVDLSPMKGIRVDPDARTARAQAGLTWGEFDAETQAFGLATTGGRVTHTGIAGLTVGSGSGWLERMYGYTADNLLSADVVTADGRVVVASETENSDLFWGIRGGGGNFGIVTEFEYRLYPVGPIILGGMLLWPREKARELVAFYREFMATAPDEVGGGVALLTAPPEPFVPEEMRGKHAVGLIVCSFAPLEEAEEQVRPLREFGQPVDIVQPMPYLALQQLLDPGNPPGLLNYWKAEMVDELSDEVVDFMIEHGEKMRSPHCIMFFQPLGGQIDRVPPDYNALTARGPGAWTLHCIAEWVNPSETEYELEWVRTWGRGIQPYRRAGVAPTFSADAGDDEWVKANFGDRYAKLVALKDKYDPDNLFRLNQNVKPSGS